MGEERRCTVEFGGRASEGTALLETDEVIFRGDFRLAIPLAEIGSVEAQDGLLTLRWRDASATFDLGSRASAWAEKIRNPRTLADKLGVKAGSRVAVLGIEDERFRALLAERGAELADGEPEARSDLVFLGAAKPEDLDRLTELRSFLTPNGAIWVVAPKGRRELREADVLAAGKEAGLVDTKVVRFSETHTAHKFVIPVAKR